MSRRLETRWLRWVVILMLLGSTVVPACSVEQTLSAPHCTEGGSALIVAQSVPDASLLPCFETLPDGWSVASVRVREDGTRIRFDSDRLGDDVATLEFRDRCEVDGADRVLTDRVGVSRYDVERSDRSSPLRRVYSFDGGCLRWTFEADDDGLTEATALDDVLQFVDRQEVNDQLRSTFVDEDL